MPGIVGNLGPRQRRRRLVMGVVMLAVGVGLVISVVALGAGRGWRLLAMLPFWAGALGLFQARAET
ncbi:MAG TPA: hypothetical protein VGL09_13235 [Methylomirabilota bacterium]